MKLESELPLNMIGNVMESKDAQLPGATFDRRLPGCEEINARPIPEGIEKKIYAPHIPRANIAASVDMPDGTPGWREQHKDKSVIQQHVLFFDPDGDGVIWPQDTFMGFWRLGYHVFWCFLVTAIIHPGYSWFAGDSWIPDPFFRLKVKTMHKAHHGSDTGTFDPEGRFIPAKFEEIFSKYDSGNKGGLTYLEGIKMVHGNRTVADPTGWLAAWLEFTITWLLIRNENGIAPKEEMRRCFDGSIFYEIAEREKRRSQKPFSGLWKFNTHVDSPNKSQ